MLLIDGRLSPRDLPFICYHEAGERRYISQGMSYNKAHDKINVQERQLRIMAIRARMGRANAR